MPGIERLLRPGSLKIASDGPLNSRTAYCADPYPGIERDGAEEVLDTPTEALATLLRLSH